MEQPNQSESFIIFPSGDAELLDSAVPQCEMPDRAIRYGLVRLVASGVDLQMAVDLRAELIDETQVQAAASIEDGMDMTTLGVAEGDDFDDVASWFLKKQALDQLLELLNRYHGILEPDKNWGDTLKALAAEATAKGLKLE